MKRFLYLIRIPLNTILIISIHIFAFANSPIKPKICMLLDKAGKDDHGFNESAYKAFNLSLEKDLISQEKSLMEIKDDAQIPSVLRAYSTPSAKTKACDLIISVGINNAEGIKQNAARFPKQKFMVVDAKIDEPNVRSIIFREDQGAYLMGVIAAIKSKTEIIGFVGGMDIPIIKRFETAFKAGAKYINPKIKIYSSSVGITIDAWNNPTKSEEIAINQYNQGADIIFQAAGGSGYGVFNAAEKMNNKNPSIKYYAIGCDSNQNWIKPGIILTSMIKNIGESIQDSVQDIVSNRYTFGIKEYNLANGGINWALDENNRPLFTKEMINKINSVKEAIVHNPDQVPDYYKQIKH